MTLENNVAIVTGGARGLGAAVARGLAGRGANVLINYAHSCDEATRWFSDALGQEGLDELVARQKAATPLQRAGTLEDVAATVLFLADEGALHNTGAMLISDAGFQLGPKAAPLPRRKPSAAAERPP
jgi:NAD(P)-dependent dehydrogenase (short-subunit alcohol dehydrogenase family)